MTLPLVQWAPKSRPHVEFVRKTGRRAAIGRLSEIDKIVAGEAGTNVIADELMSHRIVLFSTGLRTESERNEIEQGEKTNGRIWRTF